jgi:DNA-binding GntR family transcriptional regulator
MASRDKGKQHVTSAKSMPETEPLVSQAYRAIEERIVTLELEPGAAVSEAFLSRQLGIGRTPVREALHRLAREGLVWISPRRGIYVSDIRIDAQLRLLEVRRALERLMAARAARNAGSAERAEFAEIAAAMRAVAGANDDVAFLRLDARFNRRLAEVAGNEFAAAAMGLMAGRSRRFWYRYYESLADLPHTARLHADMAAAIADGNPDAATNATEALMDYLEQFTRAVFASAN